MTLALAHSSWINAWTLRRACAGLDVDLRVPAGVRQLPLPVMPPQARAEWQFFTEEASLRRALDGELDGRFLPERFPIALLDDKWAFADFLAQDATGPQGLAQWPLDEPAGVRFPLLLKGRHSWVGDRKLPRGWVCRSACELARWRSHLRVQGMQESWFFLQEWLGDNALQLLSVGGFFDADDESRNLAVVTLRVADYGDDGPSSSAALATIADSHGLIPAAEHVLRRLRYRGPYEFEFIIAGSRRLALELNPRFWMQHGLFVAAGNGLVKRYLGRETAEDRAAPPPQKLLWIDGSWLMRRLLRLDMQVIALWRTWVRQSGYRAVVCPTPMQVLGAGLWLALGGGRR
ncbi:hypothetical protein AACH06_13635 [Ideonella sp. DXS29W]|uniref:ATP-grasp domain-containing protein n=1 Tax=Ideonella lacteola TaxID=2984193 RepID=A0ABU9BQ31_9BURK